MPFDPQADHGVVSPPLRGACWYQDGVYYDNDHNAVNPETGEVIEKAVKVAPPAPKVKKPATKPRQSEIDEERAEIDEAAQVVDDDGEVDLDAWAKGKSSGVGFFKIKAEVMKQFGKTPANAAEARSIILGE